MPLPRAIILLILILLTACAPQSSQNPVTTQNPNPVPRVSNITPPTLTSLPGTATPYPLTPTTPSTSSPTPSPSPIPSSSPASKLTTLLFTGVIVPARCVQAAIDQRSNPDYPYAEVREIISQADLAVGTLNATISDYPARTGCVSTYVLVGSSENADALARAGFDAMSVATNHIKNCGESNCGDRAFFDTLDHLRRVDILPVGAGENLAHAMQPAVFTLNGVRFGIVSLGQIEPMAFAGENSPGIAVLNEENLWATIRDARQVSDVVVVMPHWGPEDVPTPNWIQRDLAQVAVEAGADLVVGNHTHVVQAVEDVDGVMVFYGLGNFVFDQNWARDHQQGVILQVTFEGDRYAGYELIPTHVDGDGRVHIADEDEAAEILERIEEVSRNLP